MHDIDRTQLEVSDEYETDEFEFESDEFESDAESDQFLGGLVGGLLGGELECEADGEMDEVEEMELASQLLEVSDEGELDQFLGGLIKKAAQKVGTRWSSFSQQAKPKAPEVKTVGDDLKKGLKKAATTFLPTLGQAVGGLITGGTGGSEWGKHVGTGAKGLLESLWGLELEGLSPEDQEFELARRYVRFADATVRNAVRRAGTGPRPIVVRRAFTEAAKRHAPGLVRVIESDGIVRTSARSGRWVRRGNTIVLQV